MTSEDVTKKQIIATIAEHIGVDSEDVKEDDSLIDDLHMSPIEITDLIGKFEEKNINTSEVDIATIETVQDILEYLDVAD